MQLLHVPYKGGAPALIDLMSGQIQMVITTTITAGPHLKSGKLRAIAVTGPKRVQVYPDLPTVAESGLPGYELTNSYGFFAPAGTPMAIVEKINAAVIQVMNLPETQKVLAADGAEAAPPATPEEFKAKFARDYAELEKTISAANIKLQLDRLNHRQEDEHGTRRLPDHGQRPALQRAGRPLGALSRRAVPGEPAAVLRRAAESAEGRRRGQGQRRRDQGDGGAGAHDPVVRQVAGCDRLQPRAEAARAARVIRISTSRGRAASMRPRR